LERKLIWQRKQLRRTPKQRQKNRPIALNAESPLKKSNVITGMENTIAPRNAGLLNLNPKKRRAKYE